MILNDVNDQKNYVAGGILLSGMGFLFPLFSQSAWFNVVVKIREAINTGDSGHLILASASTNLLYATQSLLLFLGILFVIFILEFRQGAPKLRVYFICLLAVFLLNWISAHIFYLAWEPITTILALLVSLFLSERIFRETSSFLYVSIVCIQVFFAFQWLNIMPSFSPYLIGQSDIPYSIKITGVYLQATSVLNFMGFAFFLPFIFSAFITATLFISFSQNIHMMKENYKKENEIQNIKDKVVKNRIYQEINSLVHDLKTPLVTIQGLNSLINTCESQKKLAEYSERIESSASKMSEMISSFLYEASRQKLKVTELISYIRAQLPLEDDTIKIDMHIEENLPEIWTNKIRIARAVINILENAIVVPCEYPCKHIIIELKRHQNGVNIIIRDNGIGILEENLPLIWEVGYSTSNTSGLGLPFAKQIIEDNEGSIEVMSQPGQGTSVTIFLPSV